MKNQYWTQTKLHLSESQGRPFEREVQKLLRLRYPSLVQTPSQGTLDNSGIDLVERDSEGEIDLAV